MTALTMMLTAAGLDALVDAQNGATEPIAVTEIGLTESAFILAPTLTALPGEFVRLESFAGQSVSETIIHMTALDTGDGVYDLRGIGLYLDDGTLFAAYGQASPIFRKVTIASFLLAFDVAFSADVGGAITFGDSTFLYPPASETVKGVAEIATQEEANAGIDDERIITAKKLKVILDIIRAAATALTDTVTALLNRTIGGSGLVTGGGDLTANRTLTVTAASAAEADAAALSNKALVPASLVNILASIAAKAASALTITGGGLVTGGGNLTVNRTLTVTAATGSDVASGASATVAVTPAALKAAMQSVKGGTAKFHLPDGWFFQLFDVFSPANSDDWFTLPWAYTGGACAMAWCTGDSGSDAGGDNGPRVADRSVTQIMISNDRDSGSTVRVCAVGYTG